jgi:hypothetical protein
MNAAASFELFGPPRPMRVETPIARNTDPESSHLAAAEITGSGKRRAQQDQTIAAVRKYPGRTSQELANLTGLDRYMLARRLPECVTAGAIKKGALIECTVTRKKAIAWWPV